MSGIGNRGEAVFMTVWVLFVVLAAGMLGRSLYLLSSDGGWFRIAMTVFWAVLGWVYVNNVRDCFGKIE